jgi:2-amino-4-hydroxy-6-hydroxymethyldihydropteridine diphosphokinase
MTRVFLGLGSNVGDGREIIRRAFRKLSEILSEARLSRLWGSRPLYVENQPDFVNAVAVGETELSPLELLSAVNEIEAEFGRDRTLEIPKGPRSLDIDILLYGTSIFKEFNLIIPHAGLKERRFALVPLLELDRDLLDPDSGESYSEILGRLPPQGIYLLE